MASTNQADSTTAQQAQTAKPKRPGFRQHLRDVQQFYTEARRRSKPTIRDHDESPDAVTSEMLYTSAQNGWTYRRRHRDFGKRDEGKVAIRDASGRIILQLSYHGELRQRQRLSAVASCLSAAQASVLTPHVDQFYWCGPPHYECPNGLIYFCESHNTNQRGDQFAYTERVLDSATGAQIYFSKGSGRVLR